MYYYNLLCNVKCNKNHKVVHLVIFIYRLLNLLLFFFFIFLNILRTLRFLVFLFFSFLLMEYFPDNKIKGTMKG